MGVISMLRPKLIAEWVSSSNISPRPKENILPLKELMKLLIKALIIWALDWRLLIIGTDSGLGLDIGTSFQPIATIADQQVIVLI